MRETSGFALKGKNSGTEFCSKNLAVRCTENLLKLSFYQLFIETVIFEEKFLTLLRHSVLPLQ